MHIWTSCIRLIRAQVFISVGTVADHYFARTHLGSDGNSPNGPTLDEISLRLFLFPIHRECHSSITHKANNVCSFTTAGQTVDTDWNFRLFTFLRVTTRATWIHIHMTCFATYSFDLHSQPEGKTSSSDWPACSSEQAAYQSASDVKPRWRTRDCQSL